MMNILTGALYKNGEHGEKELIIRLARHLISHYPYTQNENLET